MMRHANYGIVWAGGGDLQTALEYLTEDVNEHIQNGWAVQGGISVTCSETNFEKHFTATQAMVLWEEV